MANKKPYAFNYTNVNPPFELMVRYREGINILLKEHEACVQVTPAPNAQLPPPMKVKVFPDNGENGPEFLMKVVAMQFDSVLNADNIPGEERFKVWQDSVLMTKTYKQIWKELTENVTLAQQNEQGKFAEIRTMFYNKICAPDRDVYAGDIMLYYLQHVKKPRNMSLRDFSLRWNEMLRHTALL